MALEGSELERWIQILQSRLTAADIVERLEGGKTWIYAETNNPQQMLLRCPVEQARLSIMSQTNSEYLINGRLPVDWEDAADEKVE